MTVTQSVRSQVGPGCVTRQCRKRGCSLSLVDTSRQSFVIDMDHAESPVDRNQTHCDFLFIGSPSSAHDEWVVPIELKRGGIGAAEAKEQLQAGADIADRLAPHGSDPRFRPIAVSGSMDRYEQIQLRKSLNKIVFRGARMTVVRVRCGSPLADALRRP